MKEIQLTQGKVALVDDADYEYLNQWKWHANNMRGYYYATRNNKTYKYIRSKISMHRLIMKATKGMLVDHLDGNTLNNQKSNLRICTHSENMRNRKISANNKSGYKGVVWHKVAKKWVTFIKVNGKTIYLGLFIDVNEAARTYNEAAIKHYGEFANLNKID